MTIHVVSGAHYQAPESVTNIIVITCNKKWGIFFSERNIAVSYHEPFISFNTRKKILFI